MIIVKSFDSAPTIKNPLILTMGNFDGLHRGHKKVIRKVISRARELGGTSALLTFEPHPRTLLHPDNAPPLILTKEEKIEIVSRWGVELYIEIPFTNNFAAITAEEFLEMLFQKFSPYEIYIGEDFKFGAGRKGDIGVLKRFSVTRNCLAEAVPKLLIDGEDVSSTRVRTRLLEGNMEQAHLLLGRPFEIGGTVVAGAKRGRELGFPTANIPLGDKLVPSPGVYITCLDLGSGSPMPAVSNIGDRPTFNEKIEPLLEIHVLKGSYDLYGKKARCLFLHKLRDEKKFETPAELTEQIAKDKADAEKYFELNPLVKRAFY
jgi:riboflavin kinase / FMN adenylyltransferase